jgi:hypothetical protein
MEFGELTAWITATGAVGTGAFGVVEALKGTPLGTVGYGRVKYVLGDEYWAALGTVYGKGLNGLVKETFRRGTGPLSEMLMTGLRLALVEPTTAQTLGLSVPRGPGEPELAAAVKTVRDGARRALAAATDQQEGGLPGPAPDAEDSLESESRAVLGRFEALMSARVDAAVCAAQRRFGAMMQLVAMIIAILGALCAAWALDTSLWQGLIVGLAAVPVAPVAKDLVALLGDARTALRGRTPS